MRWIGSLFCLSLVAATELESASGEPGLETHAVETQPAARPASTFSADTSTFTWTGIDLSRLLPKPYPIAEDVCTPPLQNHGTYCAQRDRRIREFYTTCRLRYAIPWQFATTLRDKARSRGRGVFRWARETVRVEGQCPLGFSCKRHENDPPVTTSSWFPGLPDRPHPPRIDCVPWHEVKSQRSHQKERKIARAAAEALALKRVREEVLEEVQDEVEDEDPETSESDSSTDQHSQDEQAQVGRTAKRRRVRKRVRKVCDITDRAVGACTSNARGPASSSAAAAAVVDRPAVNIVPQLQAQTSIQLYADLTDAEIQEMQDMAVWDADFDLAVESLFPHTTTSSSGGGASGSRGSPSP